MPREGKQVVSPGYGLGSADIKCAGASWLQLSLKSVAAAFDRVEHARTDVMVRDAPWQGRQRLEEI